MDSRHCPSSPRTAAGGAREALCDAGHGFELYGQPDEVGSREVLEQGPPTVRPLFQREGPRHGTEVPQSLHHSLNSSRLPAAQQPFIVLLYVHYDFIFT